VDLSSRSGPDARTGKNRPQQWLPDKRTPLDENQVFTFGVTTAAAPPPFHRTKVVVVVDRVVATNSMSQTIEIRQVIQAPTHQHSPTLTYQ
jgi:hypothetical protein